MSLSNRILNKHRILFGFFNQAGGFTSTQGCPPDAAVVDIAAYKELSKAYTKLLAQFVKLKRRKS